jgi:hypothetical protein
MSPSGVSFSGVGVSIDGPVIAIGDPMQFSARLLGNAVPPAMSYFEPKKSTSAGTSFIQNQRARWTELAAAAKTVVVVGVQVRPGDDHIWGPLERTKATLVYCSGRTAAKGFRKWSDACRKRSPNIVLDGYFAEEFEAICRHAQLQ